MVIINIAGVTIAVVCLLLMLRVGTSSTIRWSLFSGVLISLGGLSRWLGIIGAAIGVVVLGYAAADIAWRKWGRMT